MTRHTPSLVTNNEIYLPSDNIETNHPFTNKGVDRSDPKITRLGILHGLGETPTLFACQHVSAYGLGLMSVYLPMLQ